MSVTETCIVTPKQAADAYASGFISRDLYLKLLGYTQEQRRRIREASVEHEPRR